MQSKGKYGKYLHWVETLVGFAMVNIAFLIATLNDGDVNGFRWKVTWLIVNVAFLPVSYLRARESRESSRDIHTDRILRQSFISVVVHALFFFSILAFLDSWVHNRSFYLWFYGMLFILLPSGWIFSRLAVKRFRKLGGNYSAVVIVGSGLSARRLRDEMLQDPGFGYKVLGIFSDVPPTEPMEDYKGTIDDMEDFLKDNSVNEIYYAMTGENTATFERVVKLADNSVAQFYYVPQISPYITNVRNLQNIGTVPVLSMRRYPLQSFANRFIKRTFDLVFSSVVLLFSPLVFIPVAIAIKLSSPGPVFFKQKRTGYLGHDFYCYKFRTMKVNAESDSAQAKKGDSRVTRVGEFLRHSSIDELPQFINVWLGDMSVVGPRPHMLKHTADYTQLVNKYMVRHFIKPGITGWAQIRGFRGQTDQLWKMEKRVECDVWYIEHWSFLLDIKIIILTVVNAIRGEENAY